MANLTFDFDPVAQRLLEGMSYDLAMPQGEVVRDALILLAWIKARSTEGYQLALVQDGEVKKLVHLPFREH